MKYAVNLADLTKYTSPEADGFPSPVMLLLRPILTQEIVPCEEKRFDGGAVVIAPETPAERIEAICWLLRHRLGISKTELRIYRGTGNARTWERIGAPSENAEAPDA